MSNANQAITSALEDTTTFAPSSAFVERANVNSDQLAALHDEADRDLEGFWARLAREHLDWHTPFTTTLNRANAPHFRWFEDGALNVSYNCIDRHLANHADKPAIIFESEAGKVTTYTYAELHREVCRLANVLADLGVKAGDRVIIYMPMIAEAVFAMQACARMGAIHSVVFGGFSHEALRDRIADVGADMVITADGSMRAGKLVPLKHTVDLALETHSVSSVLVLEHEGNDIAWVEGRDVRWRERMAKASAAFEAVAMPAEHPLFVLYTSGSTGKPKGIQHASAGYLLGTMMTLKWVMDIKPDTDVFWCTADVGWITGHSYVAYGPLACGATMLMYEGGPMTPDAGRFWKLCEDHKVSVFYTAPTALRALMKFGDDYPNNHDLSALRLLGTVGEPINPEAWKWYYEVIGKAACPIVDTWWQTETGAHMVAPIPGALAAKPGSCTRPLPGIKTAIVDEAGDAITDPQAGGYLVITDPWPSMLRTIWGNDARYRETYWGQFDNRYYVAGDKARCDADGYIWIMGRVDDVLNVSGHRLGTMEIESAIVAHEAVVEAAVVGKPHDIKGEAVLAFAVCSARPEGAEAEAVAKAIRMTVREMIGAIASPDEIRFVDTLPKTRSGKIMRRILRAVGRGEAITQDTSTLENPDIISQMQAPGH